MHNKEIYSHYNRSTIIASSFFKFSSEMLYYKISFKIKVHSESTPLSGLSLLYFESSPFT